MSGPRVVADERGGIDRIGESFRHVYEQMQQPGSYLQSSRRELLVHLGGTDMQQSTRAGTGQGYATINRGDCHRTIDLGGDWIGVSSSGARVSLPIATTRNRPTGWDRCVVHVRASATIILGGYWTGYELRGSMYHSPTIREALQIFSL